jgi:hypothetical protein
VKPAIPARHLGGRLVTFALEQSEHYDQLPASIDITGTVMTEWELSAEDLQRVLNGGRIRIWLLYTGVEEGRPLTPMMVETIDAS